MPYTLLLTTQVISISDGQALQIIALTVCAFRCFQVLTVNKPPRLLQASYQEISQKLVFPFGNKIQAIPFIDIYYIHEYHRRNCDQYDLASVPNRA